MKLRLYFDEDSMHHGLVRALRARGVDVVTALEAGMIERVQVFFFRPDWNDFGTRTHLTVTGLERTSRIIVI